MKRFHRALIAAVGIGLTTVALGCGDKLSVIGGGVRFERVYASRHPSRIAIFIPQQSSLRSANDELRLADALTRAGHHVLLIDNYEDLPSQLQPDSVDLLLVDVTDSRRLAAAVAAAPKAVLLQVIGKSTSATPDSTQPARCVTRLSRRTSLQLLRKVDEVLEQRARGLAANCTAEPAPSGA
ncbi:MAG: hypothetical protein ABIP38_06490 [Steroidobacteraceae bacterium]